LLVQPKRLDIQPVPESGALERLPVDVGFVQPQQCMNHSGHFLSAVRKFNLRPDARADGA
jgi:hypothetical protein